MSKNYYMGFKFDITLKVCFILICGFYYYLDLICKYIKREHNELFFLEILIHILTFHCNASLSVHKALTLKCH